MAASNAGREREIDKDRYYMRIAEAVADRASCTGRQVGAVLVRDDRIIATGYNGTPTGFKNCIDGGCIRCHDSSLAQAGRHGDMTDPDHVAGRGLDRCICVHAEQNAILSAARNGIAVESSVLYTTHSPCFGCLKEALQAGVLRIVYLHLYPSDYGVELQDQYDKLALHLANDDPTRFETLGGDPATGPDGPDVPLVVSEHAATGGPRPE